MSDSNTGGVEEGGGSGAPTPAATPTPQPVVVTPPQVLDTIKTSELKVRFVSCYETLYLPNNLNFFSNTIKPS